MNTNPLKQGILTEHSSGLGTVTRMMLRERAVELAVSNGRSALDASKSDWEQAKRELTAGLCPIVKGGTTPTLTTGLNSCAV